MKKIGLIEVCYFADSDCKASYFNEKPLFDKWKITKATYNATILQHES